MAKQVQITIRIPEEFVERLDKIAVAMSRQMITASRADALRFVVSKGLEPAEREIGKAKAK